VPTKPKSSSRDGILVDASLLLDWNALAIKAYDSIGVRANQVKREPFFEWLPQLLRCDIEQASVMQVARDARLATALLDHKTLPWEQPALEFAQLFLDAGHSVHVVSHETPDVLAAVIARAGLPSTTYSWSMTATDRRDEVVQQILQDTTWLAVYDVGLSVAEERGINSALAGRGVLVNVDTVRVRKGDNKLLEALEERIFG
jgi:hypothetical protein